MTERELIQSKRRRGTMLKFIRQGHEAQMARMDDWEMYVMMQDLGANMSRNQVLTMLQDLRVLGLVTFTDRFDEERERKVAECIELSALGVGLVTRRKNTDEVLFD